MRLLIFLASFGLLAGCATPFHLRPIVLESSGRSFPDLFLGGWDGHALEAYPDVAIEPGVTATADLDRTLARLSAHDYAVMYVEESKLTDEELSAHGLFCDTPTCVVVLQRNGGHNFAGYGATVAVFELVGPKGTFVGSIWVDERSIRVPGPRAWTSMCRSATDSPHQVHPDGNAWFPAKESSVSGSAGYALFGPGKAAGDFRANGYAAPGPSTCVVPAVAQDQLILAPKPVQIIQDTPKPPDPASDSHRSHRKRKHKDDDSSGSNQ